MIRDEVIQVADRRDGAPADYFQPYADDSGPFVFPLVSPWVTKSLSAPRPLTSRILKQFWLAVRWQVVFGLLAVLRDSWLLLLVGACGNVYYLRSILLLVWDDLLPAIASGWPAGWRVLRSLPFGVGRVAGG